MIFKWNRVGKSAFDWTCFDLTLTEPKKLCFFIFWHQLWSLFCIKCSENEGRVSGERASESVRNFECRERVASKHVEFLTHASKRGCSLARRSLARLSVLRFFRTLNKAVANKESKFEHWKVLFEYDTISSLVTVCFCFWRTNRLE